MQKRFDESHTRFLPLAQNDLCKNDLMKIIQDFSLSLDMTYIFKNDLMKIIQDFSLSLEMTYAKTI
jgi:hypothetical protein